MEHEGTSRGKVGAAVAAACAVAVAVAIFVLTEQPPDTTSAQSEFVNAVLIKLFGGIPGLYDPEAGTWLGISIRHWAHTAEFGALGLFVTLSAVLARGRRPLAFAAGISLAICAACSLVDQTHKLFVPARHFDWFDLCMDALGYGVSIVVVVGIAALVLKRR